jgi:uncharacterized protein (DUF2237 family)
MAENVLGGELYDCSVDPVTGWFRDGSCRSDGSDVGVHSVCVVVSAEFLDFSKRAGNDLSTPEPRYRFPGLNPGDRWCMGVARWAEADRAGVAPPVVLEATDARTLEWVSLAELERHRFV